MMALLKHTNWNEWKIGGHSGPITRELYVWYVVVLHSVVASATKVLPLKEAHCYAISKQYMGKLKGMNDEQWEKLNKVCSWLCIFEHTNNLFRRSLNTLPQR